MSKIFILLFLICTVLVYFSEQLDLTKYAMKDFKAGLLIVTISIFARSSVKKSFIPFCYYASLATLTGVDLWTCWRSLLSNTINEVQRKKKPNEIVDFVVKDIDRILKEKYPVNFTQDFKSNCLKFVKDPAAAPKIDESWYLKDSSTSYPYKGLAHCIISQIRRNGGDKAIKEVQQDLHPNANWKQIFTNRINFYRKRHQVNPLTYDENLSKIAQKWVDMDAKHCFVHYYKTDPKVGKLHSLFATPDFNATEHPALVPIEVLNGWYQSVSDYPARGERDPNFFALVPGLQYFSQLVWRTTTKVGVAYRYALRPKCKNEMFLVATFFPAGNIRNKFDENVFSPTD